MAVGFNPSTIITKPIIPTEEGDCPICLSSFQALNEESNVEDVALRAFGHYPQIQDGSQGEPHLFCERCFVQSREANTACAICRQVLVDSDHLLPMTEAQRGQAFINAPLFRDPQHMQVVVLCFITGLKLLIYFILAVLENYTARE